MVKKVTMDDLERILDELDQIELENNRKKEAQS